jgi:quercetin 2,3-dioxygenase
MMSVLRSADRGRTRLGWLDSFHTFSFGEYHDAGRLGFRDLRVINEDRVSPGEGFGRHPHRDMEIISYVLEGSLSHRDSLGTGSEIRAGEFQVMSAGTGITHSEFNASTIAPVHFLQIWILPGRQGLTPRYDQRAFPENARRGRLAPVATPDGRDGSLRIFQDASLYAGSFAAGEKLAHSLAPGRHAWLQVVRGSVLLNGSGLEQGDGASLSGVTSLALEGREDSEVLVFDLS